MNTIATPPLSQWHTRTTFVLALSAAAVGLGNVWRFAYLSGEYGGASFVLTYIIFLFCIAVPLLVAELVIGKQGRAAPIYAIRRACDRSLRSRAWICMGVFACLTGVLMLSYAVVVAGWGVAYVRMMYTGVFSAAPANLVGEYFGYYLTRPFPQLFWQSVFLALASGMVMLGVRRGLGLLVWLMVPVLIALLLFLVRFALDNGDLAATQAFLFANSSANITPEGVLVALGHAFFTLGIGVATGVSYGAYAPERIPIGRSVFAVAVLDTMIAILAGIAIFPLVFSSNLQPTGGPSLLFISLPHAYGNVQQGELFGAIFYVVLVLAALGSVVAIMEPIVATLVQWLRVARFTATVLVAALIWVVAMAAVMSLAATPLGASQPTPHLLTRLDHLTTALLLPLSALMSAIFVGWRMRPELLRAELARESRLFFLLWRFLLRYIVPLAIILMFFTWGFAPTGSE